MKIREAAFVKSALEPRDYPKPGWPEIAFAGRSNAGKSTLLNVLLNKKGLAKTSKEPGKTQTVNFFNVNDKVFFVDLPGYGYAKVSPALKETWGVAITQYLQQRQTLRLVCHLMDIRHRPTRNDFELLDLLAQCQRPTLIVATKSDKLGASAKREALDTLRKQLELDEDAVIVPFSALNKEGLRELWNVIDESLAS
ncbi:MAG: putative GTP-binding protein EngB [Candidatus Hydrogenedentota bacterium]